MARPKPPTDWLSEIPTDACEDCSKPCVRALNRLTGKTGLLDPRSAVMVGFEPALRGKITGNTARDFLKRVAHVLLKDETTIPADAIRFLGAHKFSCAQRDRTPAKLFPTALGGWQERFVERACSACGTPLLYIRNLASSNPVPCDARAPVYVVFTPPDAFMAGSVIEAELSTDFLARVDRVILQGGVEFSPDKLRFFVSHFATCTDPGQFSKGKQ